MEKSISGTSIKHNLLLLTAFFILSIILLWLPTGYEKQTNRKSIRCIGRILEVDNSGIQQFGLVKTGDQTVRIKIISGPFKGQVVNGNNPLLGIMQRDKVFSVGDRIFLVLSLGGDADEIVFVNPQDFYRLDLEIALLGIFALALIHDLYGIF